MDNKRMILNLNGQKYILGLYWQILADTKHPKAEIKRAGKEAGADMVCVPAVKNPIQAGYISKSEMPITSGIIRSLAGGLAESNTGSWLGMFQIPESDQFYYIAVHNDHILANSDIVGDADKVRDRFEQTLSSGGWQYVVAPEGYNYPGTTVRRLTLDSMSIKRAPKVRALEYKFEDLPFRKIVYILSITAVLGAVWFTVESWREEKEREAEAQRLMEKERARMAKEQIIPPWTKAIPVEAILDECAIEWHMISFSIVGWEMKSWDCDSNQVIASYDKEATASAVQLMNASGGVSLSRDGLKATLVTPIKIASTGSSPATRGMLAKAALMDYVESHVLKVAFQPVPPPQTLPGKEPPPLPPWTLDKITIESTYPIFELKQLSQVPGFIIKRISTTKDGANWNWHIEGELYVAI